MNTNAWRRQSGEGKIGFIFSVVVIIACGLVIAEWLPQRYNVGKLEDYMVGQAELATKLQAEQIKKGVLAKARQLDLPVDPKNLEVSMRAGKIAIRTEYDLELDFKFMKYTWHVEHDIDRPVFRM